MSKNDKSIKSSPNVFEHQSLQSLDAVLDYLDTIRDGFKQGHLQLSQEDDKVTLTPKGLTRVKIKAKQAKQHQEIRITLAWIPDETDGEHDQADALLLSSKADSKSKKLKKTKKKHDDRDDA
jgi:amphi-Trp domain-containing protein